MRKTDRMRNKKSTKILVYLIIFVAIVYWFFIFHSSKSLKKVETDTFDDDLEEELKSNQQWQRDSMSFFKNLELPNAEFVDSLKYKETVVNDTDVASKDTIWTAGDIGINSKIKKSPSDVVGLTFWNREFYLNGKPFRIFSGSIHYFRVVPEAWRDRLLKLKACGLNTVETYVPWNLHEPRQGFYDFKGILNLRLFLRTASELGLYVILRPGPYICSEMDFGGMPGWLLADPNMKVRSNYHGYMKAVILYFNVLLQKVEDLQFTEGGPIIMVQVENEYASYGEDIEHLKLLAYLLRSAGIKELLVTSDNIYKRKKMYFHEYALPTSNADSFPSEHYEAIRSLNPHFPFMVMELWTGWFTSWGNLFKSGRSIASVNDTIQQVLDVGGSFNLYMFHGGTNFGFTSGAANGSKYNSFVTSYDYDALLTESGDITAKYMTVRDIMLQFYKSIGIKSLPPIPADTPRKAYGRLQVKETMNWKSMIATIKISVHGMKAKYMERYSSKLPSLGYVIYSYSHIGRLFVEIPGIQIIGHIRDRILGILCNQLFVVLHGANAEIDPLLDYDWDTHFSADHYEYYWDHHEYYDHIMTRHDWKSKMVNEMRRILKKMADKRLFVDDILHLMVENQGRVSYSSQKKDQLNTQRKGVMGPMFNFIRGQLLDSWDIRYLHFDGDQCFRLSNSSLWTEVGSDGVISTWGPPSANLTTARVVTLGEKGEKRLMAPALFRTHLYLDQRPQDTFIHLQGWTKGVVIVNNFNLGRYWKIGPQTSLYLPGSLLHRGKNEILIFEEETYGGSILLSAQHFLGAVSPFKFK